MVSFPISLLFEFIALLTAIFFFIGKRNKLIGFFIPYLLLTVCVEFVGWKARKWGFRYAMYNIFLIVEIVFYTFIFRMHFKKRAFKRIAIVFAPAFIIFCLLNMSVIQGFNNTLNSYSSLIGSFFIVLFCCFFFYESILPDQIDQQLSKQPFFWISSGLLIFYLGSVIVSALFDYLRSNDLANQGRKIYKIILHSVNVILYSSCCIAFYLCPNAKKTSSSQS
jgi:hypothetical protein